MTNDAQHLAAAAAFGRHQAADLEATMVAEREEAARLGFDGVAAIQAAFAAAPRVPLTAAAEKLYGGSATEQAPARCARPRLVYSRG